MLVVMLRMILLANAEAINLMIDDNLHPQTHIMVA